MVYLHPHEETKFKQSKPSIIPVHQDFFGLITDKDIWKDGSPKPAELKADSVHDYYDILEELGT